MNNNGQPNTGSFMGGGPGPALMQLMQRHGVVPGGAAGQNPQSQPMPVAAPPMPQGGGMPQPQPQQPAPQQKPMQNPNAPAPYGNNPEAQLILKAMSDYLGHIADVNRGNAGVQ